MAYNCKKISLVLLLMLFIAIESCIEPITPELNENDSETRLVVSGKITDEEGPFRVKLTTSIPVDIMYYPTPVLNADVSIMDDKGNLFQLYGDNTGWYETEDKNLRGIPGNSYTLSIITGDGMEYESSSVLMEEVPDIDSLYYKEVENVRFEGGQTFEDIWLNILLDTRDPEGLNKYWYYEFEETWEVSMLTDYIMVEHSPPGTPNDISWESIDIDEEKRTCWVTRPSSSIIVTSTVNSPENEIIGFPVQSLGPGDDKLHIRYSILVKQSSVSREFYNYWKQLMDANENIGGIYDKIPAQIDGNVSCCDGSEKALGNFSALSVREKRLFIDKSEHHVATVSAYTGCYYYDFAQFPWIPKSLFGTIHGTDTEVYCGADFCADCRDYGTNVKPVFW